ncbi:hypothetical protein SAMN06265222_107232 [Neorhodopirellula lusitana]|uniref:Transposase n=1 Tax=Neorhodopirellula lusitana TaxID=445327 RepID=A0ABY1Q7N1_9BACT|nr:hypothetical protein SAMN06265222_107232 [Neorhodopirellula lusitana]
MGLRCEKRPGVNSVWRVVLAGQRQTAKGVVRGESWVVVLPVLVTSNSGWSEDKGIDRFDSISGPLIH